MPPISLLIKPASSNCNLRCKYCFYHSVAESRHTKSYGIMDIDTLETIVKKALEYSDNFCSFAFQGGEPTLAGLDFYKKLIDFEKRYNKKNVRIQNALQTNGMAIDDEWAKFLSENDFLVGLSLDGPKAINDANRVDNSGKGTFNRIMKTVHLFNKYGVEYNILSVVNGYVAKHAGKVYNFLLKNDFRYLQFIPCLDPLDEVRGQYQHSLTPEKFTIFLKDLFDSWYRDVMNGNMVSIRYFDNLVGIIMGYRPEACDMNGYCTCQFVIEANGGTYPCDFYVIDGWYLGNIKENSFEEMANSDTAKNFVNISRHLDPKCKDCKWVSLCRGGCRRNREPIVDGEPSLNYFCSSYKEFFDYSIDRLHRVAQLLSRR